MTEPLAASAFSGLYFPVDIHLYSVELYSVSFPPPHGNTVLTCYSALQAVCVICEILVGGEVMLVLQGYTF